MRPINSMIEFKQILGRGTRLFEGKDYFTIYDFVKAYELFNDPEWDGDPEEPEPVQPKTPGGDSPPGPDDGPDEPGEPPEEPKKKIKVKLADGKERLIQHMMATSFYDPDGKPISSEEFIHKLFGDLSKYFKTEDELIEIWSQPETRKALLKASVKQVMDGATQ